MKLRVYIKSMDDSFYKKKIIKSLENKWHDVVSIWFNDDSSINHIVVKDKDSAITIFEERVKMKLEMDGNIIWEN